MKILLIDNYDSFTWNLVQRFWELDTSIEVDVRRNDKVSVSDADALGPTHVVISPGPCTPEEAGVSREIVGHFSGRVPILGVCLGHQCIGALQGMTVARHAHIMHGKTSPIHHDGKGVFEGLTNPFTATRYHSLVLLDEPAPPAGWEVSAWTEDPVAGGATRRVIMGLRCAGDGTAPIEGVQFHPESFLTTDGPALLANFLGIGRPTPVG